MRKQPKALSLFLAVLALLFSSVLPAMATHPGVADLETLIIHAKTGNVDPDPLAISDMENMVFNDPVNNISDALLDATYGHFQLVAGPVMAPDGINPIKSITVDLGAILPENYTSIQMEDLMADPVTIQAAINKLYADYAEANELDPGPTPPDFDPEDYDRYIICAPDFTLNDAGTDDFLDSYGYLPPSPAPATPAPLRSVFSYNVTGLSFDAIMNALGKNFGFDTSGNDESCAMGVTHLNEGNVTATYSASKKDLKGWFAPYAADTKINLTSDATIDIYPISQDPGTTPGTRMVSIDGTDYRISYRRNLPPNGWLIYDDYADEVYIHSVSGANKEISTLEWTLEKSLTGIPQSTDSYGNTKISFLSTGLGDAYATVSFDVLGDGNTAPVADTRFIPIRGNSSHAFTLTGSDAEGDDLNFTVLTQPVLVGTETQIGTLTGTAPNLIYTPPFGFKDQQVRFTFRVDDSKISAVGTITFDVGEPNTLPVANPLSITAFNATPEPFVVSGSDADGDPLTFIIVDGPTDGVLSGTPPNLVYTPDNGFTGQDSFTFKANDFYNDSPAATVTIDVLAAPNTAPNVFAGADKTASLQTFNFLPGLFYGTLPGNMDSTTPNPEAELITDVGAYTEDLIGDNTTEVYTGQIYDFDGNISFTEKIDDQAKIWINGVLVISDGTGWRRTSTTNLNLTPGWNDIEIRISNGGGGSGPATSGELGIGFDPNGGTAWQPLVDPGDGSFLRVERTYDLATADLDDATVTDPEHAPTYLWTDTGLGTGTGTVTFSDPTSINPTVSFTEIGTYQLRLTADDTYDTSSDDVIITVTLANNDPPDAVAGTGQTLSIGGSNLWDPSSIPTATAQPAAPTHLTTWHDASDAATIQATGNAVTQWDDKSGNGNHMLQGTASRQPATGVRAINGLNALDFDGSDWLQETTNAYGATITDAFAFMVVERDRPHYDREDFFALNSNTWFIMSWQWDNPNAMFRFRSGGNEISRRRYAPNTSGTPTLLATYDSNTDNVRQIWVSGVNELEATSNGTTPTNQGIMIGAGGQTNDLNGAVAEFITLDGTVDAATRQNLEGYLSHKWGMADKLPTDHPHYSVPPGAPRISMLLDGASAIDNDGDPFTITWTVDSKDPADAIEPSFDDPTIEQPTVTFYEPGTYVLRITLDDGYQAVPSPNSTDTITIVVDPSSSHDLTVVNGSTLAEVTTTEFASARVPITADPPAGGDRFINWTSASGGFFADANSVSTTYTMPAADATVTANYGPNKQPLVNAGADQFLGFATIPAAPMAWSSSAWTGDANSGISSSHTYTALQCFGRSTRGPVTVNGVTFPQNFDTSGSGWSIGGSKSDWGNDDNAALTGESEKLGKDFIFNGKPRTVTFTGLIPGKTYEASFFGVAWENSTTDRSQTFSVEGLAPAVINENEFENNNGTRISCTYVATGTSQTITIAPTTTRTFHLYAMCNRLSAVPGALAYLNGSAVDPDGDALTTIWSVVSTDPSDQESAVTFADETQLDTTVTFSQLGEYTLQLAANDGYGVDVLATVVITVSAPASTSLTVQDGIITETGASTGNPLSGSEVEIIAVPPSSDQRFVNWTTDNGGSFLDAFSSTTTYTMPANTATVTAVFEDNTPPDVDAGAYPDIPYTGSQGPTQMILSSNDLIQGFQGAMVGGSSINGNWPNNDTPQKAIDGSVGSKYLNFGKVGSGFHITLGAGYTMLEGVRITTATDRPGRDPLTISIEGSNGGDLSLGSSWALIQNNISLGIDSDPGRNTAGPIIPITASAEYLHYRVIVQSMRDSSESSVHYAEIELFGYQPGATNLNLAGTATDINGDPLTITWSAQSWPDGVAPPLFGDNSRLDTPVRFTAPGDYTLRLTADDGSGPVSDDVMITLTPPPTYTLTVNGGSGGGDYLAGTEVEITADPATFGNRFSNWSISGEDNIGDENASTTTYVMPDSPATLTAVYMDNTPPVVDPLVNQTVSISSTVPWTPAWAPSDLSIKAWYDATDAATIIDDIEGVSEWRDKSGNGNHLLQSGFFSKPFSGTQQINQLNTLFFDGTDSMQQATNALGSSISEATFFKVWEMQEIRSVSFFQLDPQRFTHHISYQDRFGAAINGAPYWAGGWAGWHKPEVASLAMVPLMVSTRYSVSDNTYKNYINSELELQKAANGIVTTTGGTQLLNFKGKCGEVLILGEAIDEPNRLKITGYLAHKWGLDGDLPGGHPYKDSAPVETGVVVNLPGNATDPDGDPLTITWSVVSKPDGAPDPVFENSSSDTTTATFTQDGTYVLRLTADDGHDDPVWQEVTITVDPEPAYNTWAADAAGNFANDFTDTDPASNPDGDRSSNMMEFAFGTDPTRADGGFMSINGSTHGQPLVVEDVGSVMNFYFLRRKDYGTSGSVSYTVQFATDLTDFTNNDNGDNPLHNEGPSAGDSANYDVIRVEFPTGAKFGRVIVQAIP